MGGYACSSLVYVKYCCGVGRLPCHVCCTRPHLRRHALLIPAATAGQARMHQIKQCLRFAACPCLLPQVCSRKPNMVTDTSCHLLCVCLLCLQALPLPLDAQPAGLLFGVLQLLQSLAFSQPSWCRSSTAGIAIAGCCSSSSSCTSCCKQAGWPGGVVLGCNV